MNCCLAMLSALTACAHEDMTMFYRHVSPIYINSLLSLDHSVILYSTVMMSLCHPAMFICAFVTYIIKILCYCVLFFIIICQLQNQGNTADTVGSQTSHNLVNVISTADIDRCCTRWSLSTTNNHILQQRIS